jgi:glycosyltransferase involved in cell wall biosynthesis
LAGLCESSSWIKDALMISIAVDASALHSPFNGIGRYLRATLDQMIQISRLEHPSLAWRIYCRHSPAVESINQDSIKFRFDRLPKAVGRVLAPCLSSPAFAWRDKPSVFWGPAHRLPCWLPSTTKTVLTVHDLAWKAVPETMRKGGYLLDRAMMPGSIKRADVIITVSQATATQVVDEWPEVEGKVRVIPLGVSPGNASGSLGSLGHELINQRYFLFVGTLEPRKNLERLLLAHSRGVKQRSDWPSLAIVGERGWGTGGLEQAVTKLGCHEKTKLLGQVSDRDLRTLYANATALVMPSFYEGFGLPLVEAMSFGTPCITSNTSAMPEVVGDAGVLVDPNSVDDIFNGLCRLADHPQLRALLSSRAAERARAFSWEATARRTLAELVALAEHDG